MDDDVMIAPWFVLAESMEECWSCGVNTKVYALLLPELDNNEDTPCVLTSVGEVNEPVETFLRNLSPHFFPDFSHTASQTYWMNHCEHCSAKIGDFYLHKPSHAFFPISEDEALKIKVSKVDIPIDAEAGSAQSSWIDDVLSRSAKLF